MNATIKEEPLYFHRDYGNDIHLKPNNDAGNVGSSWSDIVQRTGFASLPFFSLYKPFNFPLAAGMGCIRVFTTASELHAAVQKRNTQEISIQMMQTAVAVIALAGTIIAHPVGMLVTTGQDIMIDSCHLFNALNQKDYETATEKTLSLVNHSLYLGMFFTGSLELSIASLSIQVLSGAYRSSKDFKHGRWIEAVAHLLMCAARTKQLADQTIKILPSSEFATTSAKYGNNSEGIPALHYASLVGDEKAVSVLLDHGADPNAIINRQGLSAEERFHWKVELKNILGFTEMGGHLSGVDLRRPLRPLDFAAKAGHINIMEILIHRGAQVNLAESFRGFPVKWSPALHFATLSDHGEAVSFLLDKGAVSEPITGHPIISFMFADCCAVHVAMRNGSRKALDALLAHGRFSYSEYDKYLSEYRKHYEYEYNDLLIEAVRNNQLDSIDWLLKHAADLDDDLEYDPKTVAMYMAIHSHCKLATLEFLLKTGASPNEGHPHQPEGWTALMSLVEHSFIDDESELNLFEKADLLISHGADVHARESLDDSTAFSILMERLKDEDFEEIAHIKKDIIKTAELLLEKGYDINQKDSENNTALFYVQQTYDFYAKLQNEEELQRAQDLLNWLIARGAAL